MNIVGLGDQAVKEAKDRIESGTQRVVVGCSQIHLP